MNFKFINILMLYQSILMLLFSTPIIILSFLLLYSSTFISIEIPLMSLFSMNMPINIILDWTSMLFLGTVMFISSMILLFSMNYIPHLEHKHFSILLLSFVFSMGMLILSDNIIFILLGWDGLGLTSFILVIFYQNYSSSASGSITIFSNRLGDIFIILSIAFMSMFSNWNFFMNKDFPLLILIFLLLAACSKSAQFPFSAWLPAAMAAPTPISALVHSSTLVTAGIFLLLRIMSYPHPLSMTTILLISSITAIYASMSANWEMDMKKIIALSTLSQIAMMMFSISLGAISLAFFHLIIHALFKSMMFLCAGYSIHFSSYQDMRFMGTFFNNSPLICTILGIATLSLMGVPFMSGFFSKDPIIETVISSTLFSFISTLMIISIGMTAAYSFRMIYFSLKFISKLKPDLSFHNTPYMEFPIIIMAPFSIMMGSLLLWVSTPSSQIAFPTSFKLFIILSMFMGMMFGSLLNFTNKKYKNMGQASNSLWFLHFLSVLPSILLYPLMNLGSNNDKTWQESYGPNYCYTLSSMVSPSPDMMTYQLLTILLMASLLPILIIYF